MLTTIIDVSKKRIGQVDQFYRSNRTLICRTGNKVKLYLMDKSSEKSVKYTAKGDDGENAEMCVTRYTLADGHASIDLEFDEGSAGLIIDGSALDDYAFVGNIDNIGHAVGGNNEYVRIATGPIGVANSITHIHASEDIHRDQDGSVEKLAYRRIVFSRGQFHLGEVVKLAIDDIRLKRYFEDPTVKGWKDASPAMGEALKDEKKWPDGSVVVPSKTMLTGYYDSCYLNGDLFINQLNLDDRYFKPSHFGKYWPEKDTVKVNGVEHAFVFEHSLHLWLKGEEFPMIAEGTGGLSLDPKTGNVSFASTVKPESAFLPAPKSTEIYGAGNRTAVYVSE